MKYLRITAEMILLSFIWLQLYIIHQSYTESAWVLFIVGLFILACSVFVLSGNIFWHIKNKSF